MINKEVYPPFFLVLKIKKICIIKKEVIDLEKMSAFEIKNILNKIDLEVLHQIYLLRCLTINQIYVNFYKDDFIGIQQFKDKKVSILLQLGVVEEIYFSSDNSALFLTKLGIDVVIEAYQIPINIVDIESNGLR